jgi:A118 family predicted phage portal protein
MLLYFTMPVGGESERAKWLDKTSADFINDRFDAVMQSTFATGDSITVPIWDGQELKNSIVNAGSFAIIPDGIIYIVDEYTKNYETYTLIQSITLEEFGETKVNVYRLYVATGQKLSGAPLSINPIWAEYQEEIIVPNVERPLYARFRSLAVNHGDLNSVKGAPITINAMQPIQEIHRLYEWWHNEFELSEKMVFASKNLFKDDRDRRGTRLPKGLERIIQPVASESQVGEKEFIHDWAPNIREVYEQAIDHQFKLVEKCVGISTGILSDQEIATYMNVDNIRKSSMDTQAFVDKYRKAAEAYLDDLVYSWETLANFYGINSPGVYDINYDWSDEYINSYTDTSNGILAGVGIGATDAGDYRQFLFDEAPETTKARIEEIARANMTSAFSDTSYSEDDAK